MSVRVYSVRGGTSAKFCLVIMPCCSKASRRWDRVRGLMLPTDFSNSQKRFGPVNRSRKISAVHLLPTISIALAIQPTRGSMGLATDRVFIALQSIVMDLYYLVVTIKSIAHKGDKYMKLAVIVGSTRQNRQTLKQAKWVQQTAEQGDDIEAELIDLKDYSMPFFDEPISPRYNKNRQVDPKAQSWLDKLAKFDAYVFVTPEYNHSITGVLKNALDYVTFEINRKPSTVVSHGTVGGARAAMHLKEILSESKSIPIPNSVTLHGVSEAIDDDGNLSEVLKANPYGPQASLEGTIAELKWYSDALEAARIGKRELVAA